MSGRDSHYDILFEQVQIGPVTARNRFYQVPHCNGMGYLRPNTLAAMRGVKAEGGWAVVCTEEVEIHANSDNGSAVEGRIGDPNNPDALEIDLEMGARIDRNCQALGLIVRPLLNMCVFSPPLIITSEQIDEMFNLLEQGILEATEDLRREGLWKDMQ